MYVNVPIHSIDNFSNTFEKENIFSSKARKILSTCAWGIRCGIPIDEALMSLQIKKPGKNFILELLQIIFLEFIIFRLLKIRWNNKILYAARQIKQGAPVCLALKNNLQGYFPKYVLIALEEAEKKDQLEMILPLLAQQMSYSAGVFKERASSFLFPVIQFLFCLLVISWSFIFIVPKFVKIWAEMLEGEEFPFITRLVITSAEILSPLFLIVLLFIPSMCAFIFFYKFEPTARFCADIILFRLPFVGKDFKKMALLEFAGCMTSYTAIGMDITKAAEFSTETIKSYWLKKRVLAFIEKTKNGMNWIEAWDQMNLGFPFYNWMARNAASTEKISEGFMQMMKFLKNDISQFSIYFIKFIQISGLIFNAILVGAVVIALATPLFAITRHLAF